RWLPGSPGPVAGAVPGGGGGGRSVRAGSALTLAAALDADHLAATSVEVTAAGTAVAVVEGGATTVTFGTVRDLASKLEVLRALAASGALRDAGAVDLEVPGRPALTPRGVHVATGQPGGTSGRTGQG
ncbi:MAG: hypothetical protein ACYDEN_12480, partial [Acidimicrobiales bacterium]